jgi:Tol biopolymer transport system component
MQFRSLLITVIGLVITTSKVQSQSSTTDIWLIDIEMRLEKPVALAPFRVTQNDYYDNQPCFSEDGNSLYYASMPDTTQSDIYEFNLRKKTYRQLTNTIESEYQPQLIPYDKKQLSIVRVDEDKAQRFYSIDVMDGTISDNPLMPNEDSLAYYCWINDTTVGAYMLNGGGGSLHQFDMKPQQSIILMQNGGFGRCLARVPGTDYMTYVQKGSDGKFTLIQYDIQTEERTPLMELPEGVEDYAWGPDGKVYIASKSKLLYYDTKSTELKWYEIADFEKVIGNYYRIAMNKAGTKLAVVSYKGNRP